jgi:hypothetical protein
MDKHVLHVEFDRVLVSDMLPAWKVKALYEELDGVPITLSEYLPDNHMTLSCDGEFVATVEISDFIDEE